MVSWLSRISGDIVRNTSLTFADLAELTDEQILVLAASAAREFNSSDDRGPRGSRAARSEGFRDEAELKAHYLQLGRLLGYTPEQAEAEFQACKARGAEFPPKRSDHAWQ